MPYTVHQGSSTHLLSLQEMVRVQRNEAAGCHWGQTPIYNAAQCASRAHPFVLPAYRSNAHWQALLDTSNTFGQPPEGYYFAGKAYPLQGRALALLIAAEKR